MKIVTKVFVKQVVTEKSKEKLHKKFFDERMRLEQECQQLLFEQRKLQRKQGVSKAEAGNRFQTEINNRREKIQGIEFKIDQLDILEIGSEIIEKEVEALVEVSVGMRWNHVMYDKAIIVEDDIIIRIDEIR